MKNHTCFILSFFTNVVLGRNLEYYELKDLFFLRLIKKNKISCDLHLMNSHLKRVKIQHKIKYTFVYLHIHFFKNWHFHLSLPSVSSSHKYMLYFVSPSTHDLVFAELFESKLHIHHDTSPLSNSTWIPKEQGHFPTWS